MEEESEHNLQANLTRLENAPPIVEHWMEKFKEGVLTSSHFKDYWQKWVPRIYSPAINETCLSWNFDDTQAQKILFSPLEEFICNADPQTVLNQLSQLHKPSAVCGKLFKLGEPTYSCRECGMDNTCVLCVDCFKNSEHRFHKYKMGTSGGGGCCDCGDIEAWKKAPFCDIHIVGTKEQDAVNNSLPEDLAERTRIVFEAVLWHAYNLLTIEQTADFKLKDSDDDPFNIDTYCTVLYNDEIHTFEQVISTLNRVIKCSQRNAIEYVTNIDREGRAVVKCSTFHHCTELKTEIEKYTSRHGNKPLKVLVAHAHEVAHQIFALKLLAWLQDFLGHGEGFRAVFCDVALKSQQTNPCIVKGILLRDSQLWKSARTHWHRLLISGMLLEYENKKALAKMFTKNYGHIMKDFIKDDHDHSFSICSLSVQLFTVSTLAHHLIGNDDVLFTLLNVFHSECSRKLNKNRKLEFERNAPMGAFKRTQYILYDLRYLLSTIPDVWDDELRKGFLHGLLTMLELLCFMEGMDSVTRQVGQHMEYEPEWESAFNLHIKLAFCISLTIKWCGSDRVMLIKAYRATLRKLQDHPCYDINESLEVRELADHSVACLPYDVSSKPVSIHLPLSRFLAGLHLHLEKFNLTFDSPELQCPKPTPVQIIEPVLRTQVMIAQVHAGMWRRNGYALLNQLYFYHNVKCRTEMLDRDINILQIGASLIESNEFMIHVLNKFNLLNWASANFEEASLNQEDSIRQTINLVEEFLQLMIVIIGERYIPGISNVTTEDRIKKEVIQHLCIKPLPHSELNKTIPDDITHETALDDVIQELAVFNKPTGSGKGVYELKPEYYNDYNVFFYHYTREELSKSEESQRKRRKTAGELECCPPPKLPPLCESYSMIVNLLQCDVMLHVMCTVLDRSLNLRARSFSELQFHKVLHLIGYGLQEEESGNYPFLTFSEKAIRMEIPVKLEQLQSSPRVEAHSGLITWVLNKFKQLNTSSGNTKIDPVLPSSSMDTAPAEVDDKKELRAKLAAKRREKIMAQMTAMQKSFMEEHAKLFEETSSNSGEGRQSISETAMETADIVEEQPVALGKEQTARMSIEKSYTCILCQEDQVVSMNGRTLVLAGFVQQATVLCQYRNADVNMDVSTHDPLYLNANLGPAPHTSTCGHVMHADCWQKYFENVMHKEHRRPYRLRHPASFDVDKNEFLCPLCECLSNTVLPLVPSLCDVQPSLPIEERPNITFEDWLNCMEVLLKNIERVNNLNGNGSCSRCDSAENLASPAPDAMTCDENCKNLMHRSMYLPKNDFSNVFGELKDPFFALFNKKSVELSNTLNEMIQLLVQVTYTRGLGVSHHPSDKRLAPLAWKSLSYTIHSIEFLLRDSNKPLLGQLSSRQRDCLESFVRIIGVLGSSIHQPSVMTSHALNLLSVMIENSNEGPSIMQFDSLGMLVPLTFSATSLFAGADKPTPTPTGEVLELHILRLVFLSHIIKIMLTLKIEELDPSMEVDISSEEDTVLYEVLNLMKKQPIEKNANSVWIAVKDACLPFLRACVLLYHYLTDVPAPPALQEIGGDTFENMCTYLNLPTSIGELFGATGTMKLIERWCNHEEILAYLAGGQMMFVQQPLRINQLVDLPHDYSELINMVSSFTCPNSDHEDSRNPTMCLVCGEILCSQSYCCQIEHNGMNVGACNFHTFKCGAGVGIFLKVRECEILLLASPHRGCFMPPPYLDDYGETDQGLRRGNPLHLCSDRYKKLHQIWLTHTIHEHIARSIESSTNIIAAQWHHL